MRPHELTGKARELYESWRRLGYSEAQALDEVSRSNIVEEEGLYEAFRGMGLSEAEARAATDGRAGGVPVDPFDEMYKTFRGLGLSEAEARAAAIGRDGTEHRARQVWAEAAAPPESPPAPVPLPQLAERRREEPPSGPRQVTLQEAGTMARTPEAQPVPQVPYIIARAETLMREGVGEDDARRQAYREIYGKEPPRRPVRHG